MHNASVSTQETYYSQQIMVLCITLSHKPGNALVKWNTITKRPKYENDSLILDVINKE